MTDSGRDHQGQLSMQLYVHCSLMVITRQEKNIASISDDWADVSFAVLQVLPGAWPGLKHQLSA